MTLTHENVINIITNRTSRTEMGTVENVSRIVSGLIYSNLKPTSLNTGLIIKIQDLFPTVPFQPFLLNGIF